jgi:cysteine sulfinate desulfinase/cysteine desulfurase-like protein
MGVSESLSRGAIRFTLGRGTTRVDVERAVAVVPPLVAAVRHDG